MSPAEYFALERSSLEKHEYCDGEVFAMAGAKSRHNVIVGNIVGEFRSLLRARPCEVYPSDMRVELVGEGRYVYPDAVVVCDGPRFLDDGEDTLLNPTVVFEVLSDSTEAYDRGEKFQAYQGVASVREIVLVETKKARVERYARQGDGSWVLRAYGAGERVPVEACGVELAVDEVYLKAFAAA